MTRISIVGYGYWGKNLVRNFNSLNTCELVSVCELNEENAKKCATLYPQIKIERDFETVLTSDVEAVVIATPVNTHFALAKKALLANKHVLVEKPMTDSFAQAKELVDLAKSKGLSLMVDHTFLYTGAVRYLKERVDNNDFGDITYIDSTRINLGLFQHDVNVLWDLAPHDISICRYILNERPTSIQATGLSHTDNDIENIAFLTLKYGNERIVHFNCSWVSPVKIRQMLIGGNKKMAVYNDMEPTEKIKIYDTSFEVRSDKEKNEFNADYRVGDIYVPKIPIVEALFIMAEDFINSIAHGTKPDSNAQLGLEVVEILEKAQISIKNKGKEISL